MPREAKKQQFTVTLSPTCKLAQNASLGKPGAIDALVARIHDRLSRFCYYLTGNEAQGQDLTQEAFIKVLENIEDLEDPRYFVPWLYRVTRNHFIDYLRRPKNRPMVELQDHQAPISMDAKMESGVDVAKLVNTLSREDRYLFLLISLEGATYDEAAEILQVTEPSVRSQLFRIRKALREDVE